jgi:hypothetical protein
MVLWDHLDAAILVEKWLNGTIKFSDYFIEHPGHWHAITYMIILPLAQLTNWQTLPEILVSLGFSLATFFLLYRLTCRNISNLPESKKWLLPSIIAFFIFSLDQAGNWLWGWQMAIFMNVFGTALCIYALTLPALKIHHLFLAIAGTLLAIYNFSTGMVLLPMGFLLILLHGNSNKVIKIIFLSIWSIISLLITYHFLISIGAYDKSALNSPDFSLSHFSLYSLNYLGGSIARYAEDIAPILVLLASAVGGWSLKIIRTTSSCSFHQILPFLALILYGILCATLTAFGRAEWDTDQAFASRYISFSNLFWIGLFCITLIAVFAKEGNKQTKWPVIFLIITVLIKCGNIANVTKGNAIKSIHYSEKAKELVATFPNTEDSDILHLYWGDNIKNARKNISILKKYRLNVFAD